MNVRYRVDLSQIERTALRTLLSGGTCPLDAQAAGRCDSQAHRTQQPVARDGSATPGGK
jgi:hypothetical protein